MTPLYTHDCTRCTFLGSTIALGQKVDIYLSCDASSDEFIVRYNSNGAEYATVGLGSALYHICTDLHDDPNVMILVLENRRDELMRKRETMLDDLVTIMGQIDAAQEDIEDYERDGWMDTDLAAQESQAENGVAY